MFLGVPMNLQQKQSCFAQNMAKLIIHLDSIGLSCSIGEVFRTSEQATLYEQQGKGIKDSLHCKKLAVDLHLFNSYGKYLQEKSDYSPLGEYWESLNPANRWGGNFKRVDSVHFEMQDLAQ